MYMMAQLNRRARDSLHPLSHTFHDAKRVVAILLTDQDITVDYPRHPYIADYSPEYLFLKVSLVRLSKRVAHTARLSGNIYNIL